MKNTFLKWFTYNRTANGQFIEIFERKKKLGEESVLIFSHILNAHLIWLDRMQTIDNMTIPDIWETQAVSDFSMLNSNCQNLTEAFLQVDDDALDLDRMIAYQNSRGQSYENTVREIYFHILMHSMYHRGQVAKLFRKSDVDPPITDFIIQMRDERMEE